MPIYMNGASSSPSNSKKKGKQAANTLEEWFDAGLSKRKKHVEGNMLLPRAYEGASADQLLISQNDSDVTIFPVRVDIGDPEKGKGLRKVRTLYHYMSEQSFEHAQDLFKAGESDLPVRMLKLIRDDVRARCRWDSSNSKMEARVSSMEPALFPGKGAVLNEIFGSEDPQGQDANGVDLADVADYCVAIRVPNTGAEKAAVDAGRNQVKLLYEELVKQCNEKEVQKTGKGKALSRSATQAASSDEEEAEVKKKSWCARFCSCYNRERALGRAGMGSGNDASANKGGKDKTEKDWKIKQWEIEMMGEVNEKRKRNDLQSAREQKIDAINQKRAEKKENKGKVEESSTQGKRGSITAVAVESLGKEKKAKNALQLVVNDVDVNLDETRHTKAQASNNSMKQVGSWQKKAAKRASLILQDG